MYNDIYFVSVAAFFVLAVIAGFRAWRIIREKHPENKRIFLVSTLYVFLLTGGLGWLKVLQDQGYDVDALQDWMLVSSLVVLIISFYVWPSDDHK